jgi:hypothetical protein
MEIRARHLESVASVALLWVGIVFFMCDWLATMLALGATPSLVAEGNPLAAPMVAAGPICSLAVKVFGAAVAATLFFVARRLDLRAASWLVSALLLDLGVIGTVSALLSTAPAL